MIRSLSLLLLALQATTTSVTAYYASSSSYGSNGSYSSSSSSSTSSTYDSSTSSGSSYHYNGDAYGSNLFVDSQSTYYDGHQQAWRYLGWYVKCGYPSDRYDESDSHSHSGSGDDNRWTGENYCQRYLIWAAYVDEGYSGGGMGEYSVYDPFTQTWDSSACELHGNGRCVPMDCHFSNTTTWKLMGVFKEASYFGDNAFFEQLFKHEGVCIWNDDDLYDFMSDAREAAWTQGCVSTGIKKSNYYYGRNNGNSSGYLYIDLKPTWNGNMTHGIYTDSICKNEYEGSDVDVDEIAASMGLLYGDYLDTWNDALEVFKVCQPCKTYNLKVTSNSSSNYNNDKDRRRRMDDFDAGSDPNEGYFLCADDAGWTNVNQCMKYRTHAELEVATWEDLVTATNQGGILEVDIGGTTFGSARMSKEHWDYLQNQRRSELEEEAKEAERQLEELKLKEPVSWAWQVFGAMTIIVGSVAIVYMLIKIDRRRKEESTTAEPLLDLE